MARASRFRLVEGGDSKRDMHRDFERYYRESFSMVYNYIFRRVGNHTAAEDITSEAYLRAARYFSRFDPTRAKFSTWVISIANNCVSDYFSRTPENVPIEDIAEGAYAEEAETDQIGDAELASQLLATLDDEERQLVYLKYYEQLRNTEIAQIMGMNASTISTKLSRAMAKMRAVAS